MFNFPIISEQCAQCGFVFQNPQLSGESIRKAYDATNYWDSAYKNYLDGDRIRILNARRRIQRVVEASGIRQGLLLDIGSATGVFGVAAREVGFSVRCVEPSHLIVDAGRKAYGLDFLVSTWDDAPEEPEKYDLVTLWGTDSHFLNPIEGFKKIARSLRPGGSFAMNYQAFEHPIRRVFPRLKTGWNVMYNLTDHSFSEIMRQCGLRVVVSELEWQLISLDQFLRMIRAPSQQWTEKVILPVPGISYRRVIAMKSS